MALEDIQSWISRARAATDRVMDGFEERMGYEPDFQKIRATPKGLRLDLSDFPEPARLFFGSVSEVSWPDIWNGYFIGPVREVVRRRHEADPDRLSVGSVERECAIIGSDGGGSYFVLDLSAEPAVLRVSEATIHGRVLCGRVEKVAPSFDAFLELLVENAERVAAGSPPVF